MRYVKRILKPLLSICLMCICFSVLDWLMDTSVGFVDNLLKSILAVCGVYGVKKLQSIHVG